MINIKKYVLVYRCLYRVNQKKVLKINLGDYRIMVLKLLKSI